MHYNTGTTEAFNVNFGLIAGTNYDGKTADTWEANILTNVFMIQTIRLE